MEVMLSLFRLERELSCPLTGGIRELLQQNPASQLYILRFRTLRFKHLTSLIMSRALQIKQKTHIVSGTGGSEKR